MIAKTITRPCVLALWVLAGNVLLSASAARHPPSLDSSASYATGSHLLLFEGAHAPFAPLGKELVLSLDPAQSKIRYTLGTTLHTVHGTFALKRGSLRIEPDGKASGELVADATSGESGDSGRDKKMHKDVLESAKYTEVVFRPDRIEGTMAATGSVTVLLHGRIGLHGAEHELMVAVRADLTADRWHGATKFRIPYVEWGMKSPSNFFLKADPVVDLDLELAGTIAKP
jgi:polyisoprenoid-binding protein YceI